jgi:hypothetical protein
VTGSEEYLLDNQQVEVGQRFDALWVLFAPLRSGTRRRSG